MKEGTSGAPLLSPRGLLGMVIQDSNSNVAVVVAIEAVARAFEGWNHPWSLEACGKAPREATPVASGRFELGLGIAYGLPFGLADGGTNGNLDYYTRGDVPLILDCEFRVTPDLFVGGLFQYARLLDNNDTCPDCAGSMFHVGLIGRYRFALGSRLEAWAGLGAGYDQVDIKGRSPITWRGAELLRLEAGGDLAITPAIAVGPFVSFSLSYYDKTGIEGVGVPAGEPMWLVFGLRTAVFIR